MIVIIIVRERTKTTRKFGAVRTKNKDLTRKALKM